MSEYEEQANNFLKETKTSFKAKFLKHGKHFDSDEEERDIYTITLKRGEREYKFKFGQSINNSNGNTPPTSYDVLACLNKSEVEDFKGFCASFGYDEDSIKALKIHKLVLEEYNNLKMLFSDAELEKMQEIQ